MVLPLILTILGKANHIHYVHDYVTHFLEFSRSQTTWSLPFKFASVVPICRIYGGLNPFCDISHGHGTISLSLDRVLDQVCRCLRSQKSFLEKNINKFSKYCVIFFCIIFLDSTLLICQKYRIIIRLPWLAGAAGWPPAPTSS